MIDKSKRIPCNGQGEKSPVPNIPDEDTPCLICSGDIGTVEGSIESHVCPFSATRENPLFAVFRVNVDVRFATEAELLFIDQQKKKASECKSGVFVVEL